VFICQNVFITEIQRIRFILDSIGDICNGFIITHNFDCEDHPVFRSLLQLSYNQVRNEFRSALFLLQSCNCVPTDQSCVRTDVNQH
jgi:hypothetical protein